MPEWLKDILTAAAALGLGGAGMWAFLAARVKKPADLTAAQAAYQVALNAQAQGFTASLMELIGKQNHEIDELRSELEEVREAQHMCEAENRQMRAMVDSLQRRIREMGADLPGDLPLDKVTIIGHPEDSQVVEFGGSKKGERKA